MSQSDKFFQFPIGALHFGKPITAVDDDEMKSRLHEIINFCVVEVGTKIVDTKADEIIMAMAGRAADSMGASDANLDDRKALIQLCGAEQLNVGLGGLNWKNRSSAHREIQQLSGYGNQQCRLRADLVWEAINGNEWTWRSVATLCAVYAGIGRYARAKLTYDRIGAMSLGFNGQRERDKHAAKRWQLTDRQTQWTVGQLCERSFFVMASPNRRHMFYSHRMNIDELVDNLAESGAKRLAESKLSVTERIRQRVQELTAEEIM